MSVLAGFGAAVVVVALGLGFTVVTTFGAAAVTGAGATVVGARVVVVSSVVDVVEETTVGLSSAPADVEEEPSGSTRGTTTMAEQKMMKKTIFLIRLCAGLRTPPP